MRPRVRIAGLLALLLASAGSAAPATQRVVLEPGLVAALIDGEELFLEATPRRGEGLLGFSKRFCGTSAVADEIAAANDGRKRLLAGVRHRVPFNLLVADYQLRVVRALFPEDRGEPRAWVHKVRSTGEAYGGESLWQIAEWFTGKGENFRALREANQLVDDEIRPGLEIAVPAELLRPTLRASLPPPPPDEPAFPLEFGRDPKGDYAAYRLRPGEALYSSVVVRFTGRLHADDVNALATEIAARSGIADVTDIRIGFPVKVPIDLLLPEFLPAEHPRRKEYEEVLAASARFRNQVTARGLVGVTVILDAGHGGRDVGASMSGVWESLYVYDIMVRAKHLLETRTAARVVPTTRDGKEFRIPDRDVLEYSRGHAVLTSPAYPIEESTIGVHLRWYLANSVFRRGSGKAAVTDEVIFVSIHADSLHQSLRGATVYIPDASKKDGAFGRNGPVFEARKEWKEQPRVSMSSKQRIRSEGLSRDLAERVIASFNSRGLAVHPFKPVRERVFRNRREWVPAVLRYNSVPAKILLEVCNLANAEDRRLIQTRSFRQEVAEALVEGILAYYGARENGKPVDVAKSGR